MGYAVYHTEKGKASGGGIGHHIDRTPGREYSYSHADPERKNLNVSFQVHKGRENTPLHNAISERIAEGYKGKRKIRNDAVRYLNHVLTGSHEDMKEIFNDKDKSQKWLNENYKFACQEFGHENIVRFTLHLDEKTPHIHCVTVPLTSDGKLSAKEIMGNKKVLRERQDKYADMMKVFGLKRGLESSTAKHETQQQYYARTDKFRNEAENMEIKPVKSLLWVKSKETIEKLTNDLKTSKMVVLELEHKLGKSQANAFAKNDELKKEAKRADDNHKEITRINRKVREVMLDPIENAKYVAHFKSQESEKIKKEEAEKAQKANQSRKRGFRM